MKTATASPDQTANSSLPLVCVRNLTVDYHTDVPAINGVDLDIGRGQIVGLVGESGSGKSTLGFMIAGLLDRWAADVSGVVEFDGVDIVPLGHKGFRRYRQRSIGVVFQDAQSSLNPLLTIGTQLGHALRPGPQLSRDQLKERKSDLLRMVGIPDARGCLRKYPHELSGGMQQRVIIAAAIACSPELLIADEPTTALDVTVQAQITELLERLSNEMNMAILFISHDLSLVARLSQQVYVMRQGKLVDSGPTDQVLRNPSADYTKALIAAAPHLEHVAADWLAESVFWNRRVPKEGGVDGQIA